MFKFVALLFCGLALAAQPRYIGNHPVTALNLDDGQVSVQGTLCPGSPVSYDDGMTSKTVPYVFVTDDSGRSGYVRRSGLTASTLCQGSCKANSEYCGQYFSAHQCPNYPRGDVQCCHQNVDNQDRWIGNNALEVVNSATSEDAIIFSLFPTEHVRLGADPSVIYERPVTYVKITSPYGAWVPAYQLATIQPRFDWSSAPTIVSRDIVPFLQNQGITSPSAIAVILGNLEQESSFNPLACQAGTSFEDCPTNSGVGLLQWTASRHTDLTNYCGASASTTACQLKFMAQEPQFQTLKACLATCPDMGALYGSTARKYADGGAWRCAEQWVGWGDAGSRETYAKKWAGLFHS